MFLRYVVWMFLGMTWAGAQTPQQKTMVITIDDLPFTGQLLHGNQGELAWLQQRTKAMLEVMSKHQVPAIGFVNESKLQVRGELDERLQLLADWLDAGMELGNHSFSHPSLSRTPLVEYQEDVIRGEVMTRWLLKQYNQDLKYYRYPFNHRGPTKAIRDGFEAFLNDRGYRVAPFTIEHSDYLFNSAYTRAALAGDQEKKNAIGDAYVAYLGTMIDFFEEITERLFKRQIPQILLIHTNEINVDYLEAMLVLMEKRGYRFISLDEALKDPAYQTPDGFVGTFGPSWLHRFSLSLGVAPVVRKGKSFPAYLLEEPDPPALVR